MIETLDAIRDTLAPLPVVVRCVLAFLAFGCLLVGIDWVVSRVLGRENSQFFSKKP